MNMTFVITVFTFLVLLATAFGENEPWDCPDCGRTENKANYCGECEYPAPWTDPEAWKDDTAQGEARLASFCKVGGYVTFGSYEQDNNIDNGKEPIKWRVLEYDAVNNRALLLSHNGLDSQPYNAARGDITWEKCTLRKWLNGTFLNGAFTQREQASIALTSVDNSNGQGYIRWSTSGGKNSQDKVFLLSYT